MWQEFLDSVLLDVRNYTRPSALTQYIIILICFVVAHFAANYSRPVMNRWLAKRQRWPLWIRQFFFAMIKHIRLIYFFFLTALARAIMLQTMMAPRSYFINLAATVAAAMILALVVSRLIRNKFLRRSFKWLAWIGAFLYFTGYYDETINVLKSFSISIGDFELSLYTVGVTIFYLTIFLSGARILGLFLENQVQNIEDITPSQRVLASKVISFSLITIAVLVGLRMVGLDLSNFALLSGAIGVGIGFGLQKVVSNLVSGVILLLDKSIKPGDVISLGETFGWITHLGSRYVSVNTRDGKTFLIPNEDLITGQVVNWTHSSEAVRLDIYIGCSYHNDPHEVRRVCVEAVGELERVLKNPKPVCHIVNFGESSVDYVLRFWIKDPTSGLTNVRGDAYLAVWDKLKAHDIEIPFPQRDIRIVSGAPVEPPRAENAAPGHGIEPDAEMVSSAMEVKD